jgi:hypothetical protein
MIDEATGRRVLEQWLDAANSHDIERIVPLYAEDAEFVSPLATTLMNEPGGALRGVEAIRTYLARAMAAYPHLHLQLIDLTFGMASISPWYINHKGSRSSAYLEFDALGRITRHVNHYSRG